MHQKNSRRRFARKSGGSFANRWPERGGHAGREKIAGPAMSGASMPLQRGGYTAVYQDVGSGDERGRRADQPFHGGCNFGRRAYTSQRCVLQLFGDRCGPQFPGSHRGRDNSRAYRNESCAACAPHASIMLDAQLIGTLGRSVGS